jgi:CDP-diacylglycerol--glycerol-3-phosphate 3-phosphatidyltransferase
MSRLRWLPNALTIARLAALPALLALLIRADGPTEPAAAWLFAAICVTDFVDGRLARALHAESRFGRLADPLADRLAVAVGLVGLILLDRVHWAGPALILARDGLSIAAFVWYARRGVMLAVDMPGKVASSLAMIATALALLSASPALDALFWTAVAASVLTLANYARTARRLAREAAALRAQAPREGSAADSGMLGPPSPKRT